MPKKLVHGHQIATVAWLWRATGVTRELLSCQDLPDRETHKLLVQSYLAQWNKGIMQAPGVAEYLMQHKGCLMRTMRCQLLERERKSAEL